MKNRSTATEAQTSATPACWQREAPSACLRVELLSGEVHLFSYQHFVTASLQCNDAGGETVRITFSIHELDVEGRGLRELLLGLQDFAVKWVRPAPDRYHALPVSAEGIVTGIRITMAE
jgi:hypothetical protein